MSWLVGKERKLEYKETGEHRNEILIKNDKGLLLIIIQAVQLHSFEEVSAIIDEAEQYPELISNLEKSYGVQLNEKILSYLTDRNSDLYTCVGCFPGEVQTTEKLIEYYAK